jgi:hypothetical protein
MKLLRMALGAAIALSATGAFAQDKRVYDLGPVVAVSHVKVEPGQLDAYMSNLNNVWRKSLEEGKRRGEVLDYGVYSNMAPGVGDPDLMLVITYKNAAVMDTSLDELDRRTAALQGSVSAAQQASVARGKLRTIMGSQLLRELKFK